MRHLASIRHGRCWPRPARRFVSPSDTVVYICYCCSMQFCRHAYIRFIRTRLIIYNYWSRCCSELCFAQLVELVQSNTSAQVRVDYSGNLLLCKQLGPQTCVALLRTHQQPEGEGRIVHVSYFIYYPWLAASFKASNVRPYVYQCV